MVELIEKKGAFIKSLKESWLDTTTPTGMLMFTLIAGVSQFERDLASQRTIEGLAAARARGRVGGRKRKLDVSQRKALTKLYEEKSMTVKEICKMFDISKTTLYNVLKEQIKL